jgi:hypothetical protein
MSTFEINRKMRDDMKEHINPLSLSDLLKYRANLKDIRDDPQVYKAHFHLRNWTTDSKLSMLTIALKNKGYGENVLEEADKIAFRKNRRYANIEDIKAAKRLHEKMD